MMTYSVECEWTRGDGAWRRSGTIALPLKAALRKAEEKRGRPERYRNVRVMGIDTSVTAIKGVSGWVEVG